MVAPGTSSNFRTIKLMLLGPGRELAYREMVRDELMQMGYTTIIIMEDIKDKITDRSLDDKFHRIKEEFDPALFIAFFHNGSKMDGVVFEIGWLCCEYHASGLSQKLRIFAPPGYDWKETTPYIQSLFSGVPSNFFDENRQYSKASNLIHKCVLDFILRT